MIIAGHNMANGIHGLACEMCGRKFSDIACVRASDIGQIGFCHQGSLNQHEFDQIRAEVERQWVCVMDIASGRGIGGTLPGVEVAEEDWFG